MAEADPELASGSESCTKTSDSARINDEYKDINNEKSVDSADVKGRNTSKESDSTKDFRKTAKYNDKETYSSQLHHSIGTGLYLTDEVLDLPPRFKNKVITALKNAAALNNIRLPDDPMKLLLGECAKVVDDKLDNSDSLVTFSTSKIIAGHGNKSRSSFDERSGNRGRYASTSSDSSSINSSSFKSSKDGHSGSVTDNALSRKKFKDAKSKSDTDSLCSNVSVHSEITRQNTESPEHTVNSANTQVVHPKYHPLNSGKAVLPNSSLEATSKPNKHDSLKTVLNSNTAKTKDTSEYIGYLTKLLNHSDAPPSDILLSCDNRNDSLLVYHSNPNSKHDIDSQISHSNTAVKPKNILHELFKNIEIDNSDTSPIPPFPGKSISNFNHSSQKDLKHGHNASSKSNRTHVDRSKGDVCERHCFKPSFKLNQDYHIKHPNDTFVNKALPKYFTTENEATNINSAVAVDKKVNNSLPVFSQGSQQKSDSFFGTDSSESKTLEHKSQNLPECFGSLYWNHTIVENLDDGNNKQPLNVSSKSEVDSRNKTNKTFYKGMQNKQNVSQSKDKYSSKSSVINGPYPMSNPMNSTTSESKSHKIYNKTVDFGKKDDEKVPKCIKDITQKQCKTELGSKLERSVGFGGTSVSSPHGLRKSNGDTKRKLSEFQASQAFAFNRSKTCPSKEILNDDRCTQSKGKFVTEHRNVIGCVNTEQRDLSPHSDSTIVKNNGFKTKMKVNQIKNNSKYDVDFNDSSSVNSDFSSKVSNDSKRSNISFKGKSKHQRYSHNGTERKFNNKRSEIPERHFAKNNESLENDFDDKDSQISVPYSEHSFDSSSKYKHAPRHKNNISKRLEDTVNLEKSRASHFDRERKSNNGFRENGFFLKIAVSEENDLEYWVNQFKQLLFFRFDLEKCCHFSGTLILSFESKPQATEGYRILNFEKKKKDGSYRPHIINISDIKFHIVRPCDCRQSVLQDSINEIKKNTSLCLQAIHEKIDEVKQSKTFSGSRSSRARSSEFISTEKAIIRTFNESKNNFLDFKQYILKNIETSENLKAIQQWKVKFIIECNAFKKCLPIYSRKDEILKSLRYNSVTVIVAETGSGKSTQLGQYIFHSTLYHGGLIVCTQPRKLAAISVAQFVSGQMGTAVGKMVGYDVGMEKKITESTKILYMTDYSLLKTCLRSNDLKHVSFVIIDEAHERSLYTDLLLGKLKQLIPKRPDLRIIITSATINPIIFVNYFNMPSEAVIDVPGRSYPVEIVWWSDTVELGWNYLAACVKKALEVHRKERDGDILVFLTSPGEVEEAMNLFRNRLTNTDEKVMLYCLHGKSDIKEQMQIFEVTSQTKRRIIFATNVAETSVTIPGIKYVIDSGMNKELMFDAKKNKNYLAVNFINKSSAEQRKGRAGRTQSGVCYRLYDKCNYESMSDSAVPEILKSNLQKAVLKIFELGIEPSKFDFIQAPASKTISNSIDSLEYLGAVENKKLTPLGKKLVKLPLEPQLSKLVLLGIDAGIGYEIIIIAALLSESGKLFLRFEDNREIADEKKRKFCNRGGDLCTYLDVFKRWKEVHFPKRYEWCVHNMVSSKSLNTAAHTVVEIMFSLRNDLSLFVEKTYSSNFKKKYERVLFESFSENLCVSSGHPKLGYYSPFLSESFFIHPSSALCYLGKERPEYLVYSNLMETSRNFLFDVTPISEEIIQKAYEAGTFTVPLHSLKCLQIIPKVIGHFGESVLIRHILGKSGTKVRELENRIKDFTNTKNIQIDVAVDKGLITIYVGKKFHDKISKDIHEIIDQAVAEMANEEDVIKMSGMALYYALGAGGLISDIIMPGEYRDLILRTPSEKNCAELEHLLRSYGPLHSMDKSRGEQHFEICVTFKKVIDAKRAFFDLKKSNICSVSSKPCLLGISDATSSMYMLQVSWCRCPCNGYGVVEFHSHIDLIVASGILTSTSFYLDDKRVLFQPSPKNDWSLEMSNLPKNAEIKAIEAEVKKLLPCHMLVKNISLSRRKAMAVTDGAIADAKKKLQNLFGNFTVPAKLTVDIKYPKSTDTSWEASVYFEIVGDGEEAFKHLSGHASIDSYPLQITRILKSSVNCKLGVYNSLSKIINNIFEKKKTEGSCKVFDIVKNKERDSVRVNFECTTLLELIKMKQILMDLVQGDTMDLIGISKYHFLFSDSLSTTIKCISKSTNTLIHLNKFRKVITLHGLFPDCQKAKQELYSLANDADLSISRVFNLKDSAMPAGFIKRLYTTYSYDLHKLVNSFKLSSARVELTKLTLVGNRKSIKEAEIALEKLCEELYQSRGQIQSKGTEENCPICLDPVTYDFFRLEHCGHAICRQCLLLQLEAKCIPFVCVMENCGKLIVLEDIKRIISYGGDKKSFCASAIQYHVSSSAGKLSYCPTPDCPMIYRVSDESAEFSCPECQNSICTKCQKLYHYGMTCEMFKQCQTDEDFSLKYWVKENEANCKPCPSCKIVIEKNQGCNHMECLNCHKHFCWLCLKVFIDSDKVYEHLPYCPNNQS